MEEGEAQENVADQPLRTMGDSGDEHVLADTDQAGEGHKNVADEPLRTMGDGGDEQVPVDTDQRSKHTSETEDFRLELEDQAAADRDVTLRGLPYDSCFHINNTEAHT